jgi:uncharacterized protein (DUF1501 family)
VILAIAHAFLPSGANPAMHRRSFLQTSMNAFGSLSLAQLMALRASASTGASRAAKPSREKTALIVVWLQGGASHLETWDPKPDAPAEIRGPFGSIATSAPGIRISELLPMQAKVAHRFTILRSLVHTGFCHQQGNQQMFTGHPEQILKLKPEHPDLMCVASRERAKPGRDIPAYVGVNPIPYLGSSYLGTAYEPFSVYGDPNQPSFRVDDLGQFQGDQAARLSQRLNLSRRFDDLRDMTDKSIATESLDTFQRQALSMLTSTRAREAFDISREDPRIRDRYGRNTWGQRCLLARRLVEAGVDLVTTSLDGPLCGRIGNWDDHAVNHHVFDAMKSRCLYFDQAVSALIEDIYARNLDKRVLVIVTGEFGRTPRINYDKDSASGVRQPGRDHWPRACSLIFAGGGLEGGRVVGGTDAHGADVVSRRAEVRDFLATIYAHLGIDAAALTLEDRTGRPFPVLPTGVPISELVI